MSYTTDSLRAMPPKRIKRLLLRRGWTLTKVGKTYPGRPNGVTQPMVSRLLFKQAKSEPLWRHIAKILNGRNGRPRRAA